MVNLPLIRRRNKYGARKVVLDGITFHSGKEGRRYMELKMLALGGQITNLEVHPRFELHVNGKHFGFYTSDFAYNNSSGEYILEDVKSPKTRKLADYRMRKRLMKLCLGIEITEV